MDLFKLQVVKKEKTRTIMRQMTGDKLGDKLEVSEGSARFYFAKATKYFVEQTCKFLNKKF